MRSYKNIITNDKLVVTFNAYVDLFNTENAAKIESGAGYSVGSIALRKAA